MARQDLKSHCGELRTTTGDLILADIRKREASDGWSSLWVALAARCLADGLQDRYHTNPTNNRLDAKDS